MTTSASDAPPLTVAVFGIINAGKSSLINALTRAASRATGPIGGTTAVVESVGWSVADDDAHPAVVLLDTPGLEEVEDQGRGALAITAAERADLVVFVLAEDLTASARSALVTLRAVGKPIVVVVNKIDLLDDREQGAVMDAVRHGLDGVIDPDDILAVSAAPIVRHLRFRADGSSYVETTRGEPGIGPLEERLREAIRVGAADLRALNQARDAVATHVATREVDRARLRDRARQVADETGAALAIAMAVNPIPLLDFLAGPGGLAILVRRVMAVYGETPSTDKVKALAGELLRGGRARLWGSLAGVVGGGAMKLIPGIGHVAGAIAQGASAGYFAHVLGRALVVYLENGHDWGDAGLNATLDRIARDTDRRSLTRGLADQIRARIAGTQR